MDNINELSLELQALPDGEKYLDQKIELSFKILDLYCEIKKATVADNIGCLRTVIILTTLAKKGLGARAFDYFNERECLLPDKALMLLRDSFERMEGSY